MIFKDYLGRNGVVLPITLLYLLFHESLKVLPVLVISGRIHRVGHPSRRRIIRRVLVCISGDLQEECVVDLWQQHDLVVEGIAERRVSFICRVDLLVNYVKKNIGCPQFVYCLFIVCLL